MIWVNNITIARTSWHTGLNYILKLHNLWEEQWLTHTM